MNTPSRPLIIELAGLPGAGKSTLCAALVDALREAGFDSTGRLTITDGPRARLTAILGVMRRPRLILSALALWFALKPRYPGRWHQCVRLLAWPRKWERASGRDVMVLEEGVVQNLWGVLLGSAAHTSSVAGVLNRLMSERLVPAAFIHVQVDPALSLARMKARARPGKRLDMATAAEQARLLRTHGAQIEELLALAAGNGDGMILAVDGAEPSGEAVAAVTSFVRQYFGGTAPAAAVRTGTMAHS